MDELTAHENEVIVHHLKLVSDKVIERKETSRDRLYAMIVRCFELKTCSHWEDFADAFHRIGNLRMESLIQETKCQ